MDENRIIRESLDSLIPDDQQKKDIWDRIEACADVYDMDSSSPSDVKSRSRMKKNKTPSLSIPARVIAVAAAFILVFAGLTWFSSTSEELPDLNGYVYAAESRATDMTAEEILVFTGDPAASTDLDVYAPAVYYMDSDRLIFGNGTGLIIYSLADSKVEGLVDMQAICSGYYNTDNIRTHVLVQDDRLIVYNAKSGGDQDGNSEDGSAAVPDIPEPWGFYHIFDLSQTKGGASLLDCIESGDDKDKIQGFIEEGSAYEHEHLMDAFDNMAYVQSDEMDDIVGYSLGTYSEYAFVADTDEQSLSKNILVCRNKDEHTYELCSETGEKDSEPVFTRLNLGITDEMTEKVNELNRLPEYRYNGDDPAVGAICEYLAGEYAEENFITGKCAAIPAPTIFRQEQVSGELLVFGNFWCETYRKNGNTLISVSGGEMPACFHLVRTDGTYRISDIDAAEDGEGYGESIRKMTEGFPGLYEEFMSGGGLNEKIRKEAINDYVLSNGLGIDYYKDYGWDPVALN